MPCPKSVAGALLCLLALGVPALAQEAGQTPPPFTLSYAEGRVEVARHAAVEPASPPDLIEEGDRLMTSDGRAELVGDDGLMVHLDAGADLHVTPDMRLRLVRGRILVHTPPTVLDVAIALPVGDLRLEPHGRYDIRADDLDGDTVVAVIDGRATLSGADDAWPLGAGDVVHIDPRDRRPRWSRVPAADDMRLWSSRRADRATLTRAASTLPPGVEPWGDELARAGRWDTLAPFGQVWFPAVAPGWRPFTDGQWRFTRRGWTWIDRTRWGWPVHHYGRWGWHGVRGWYWRPQRTWGPGWVRWAIGADHVGWAPLGWDARPVEPFPLGGLANAAPRWGSTWTFATRQTFGRPGRGAAYVDPRALPGPVLGGFVSQPVGPRGPADRGDRFFARPGQWSTPRVAPLPSGPAPITAPPRIMDARRGGHGDDVMRRPGDAPAWRPAAPPPQPARPDQERAWSTAEPVMSPVDPAPAERRPIHAPRPPAASRREPGATPSTPTPPPPRSAPAAGAGGTPHRGTPSTPPSAAMPRRR